MMACSSSTIWRVATLDCGPKISSCFSNPASTFLFFSTTTNSNKQWRFIACSLDPISTSSITSQNASHQSRTDKKSVEIERSYDGTFSVLHSDEHKPYLKRIKNSKKDEAKNEANKGLKSDSKKRRPLWRKAFFASKKMRSILFLNAITIVYASDIPVIKEVEAIMNPAAFSAVRFIMSAIPFLPFVFRSRGDVQTRNAGIELGFWISLGYLLEALGLLTSDAGRASFISLFTVIVVPLLDGLLGSTIPARTWFGVLMSALGVGMLECSGSPPQVGDLFNFLSAIFFGIHMLRTEHIS